jgi:biopolymer transport protein TolR
MAMTLGSSKGIVADMNVTPMIDVLLVLIIVFMIVNSATTTTGLDALAPHPADKPGEVARTVVVQLFDNGSGNFPMVKINQEPVEWNALRARLVEIYKTRAERVMFIKADRNLDFEQVATVIDTAHGAFQDMKIGLITT